MDRSLGISRVSSVSLGQYARVLAGLSAGAALDPLLARERLRAAEWQGAEEGWSEALAHDAEQGGELHQAFDRELAQARDTGTGGLDPLDRDLTAWLDFFRGFAGAAEPLAFLAERGVRPLDLGALTALWSARLAAEPSLREQAAESLQRDPGDVRLRQPREVARERPRSMARAAPRDEIELAEPGEEVASADAETPLLHVPLPRREKRPAPARPAQQQATAPAAAAPPAASPKAPQVGATVAFNLADFAPRDVPFAPAHEDTGTLPAQASPLKRPELPFQSTATAPLAMPAPAASTTAATPFVAAPRAPPGRAPGPGPRAAVKPRPAPAAEPEETTLSVDDEPEGGAITPFERQQMRRMLLEKQGGK